jgi:hypothetical protein
MAGNPLLRVVQAHSKALCARAVHHVVNAGRMTVSAKLCPIQTNPDCWLKSAADIVRKGSVEALPLLAFL